MRRPWTRTEGAPAASCNNPAAAFFEAGCSGSWARRAGVRPRAGEAGRCGKRGRHGALGGQRGAARASAPQAFSGAPAPASAQPQRPQRPQHHHGHPDLHRGQLEGPACDSPLVATIPQGMLSRAGPARLRRLAVRPSWLRSPRCGCRSGRIRRAGRSGAARRAARRARARCTLHAARRAPGLAGARCRRGCRRRGAHAPPACQPAAQRPAARAPRAVAAAVRAPAPPPRPDPPLAALLPYLPKPHPYCPSKPPTARQDGHQHPDARRPHPLHVRPRRRVAAGPGGARRRRSSCPQRGLCGAGCSPHWPPPSRDPPNPPPPPNSPRAVPLPDIP
jgi:hypothetical protein